MAVSRDGGGVGRVYTRYRATSAASAAMVEVMVLYIA